MKLGVFVDRLEMSFLKDAKTGRFVKKAVSRKKNPLVNGNSEPPDKMRCENGLNLWVQGRRIVEFDTLANDLAKCAGKGCNLPQDLRNIVSESRSGFGSTLYIRCSCGTVNKVKTCKTHKSARGRPIFDVNTAAAAAMIHAGMSQVAMERFASTLDIHPPCKTTVKRREREIGPIIEKVARVSCEEALGVESGLVGKKNGDGTIGMTAGYDMGWQRRSSGRSYSSRSGHGALIGKESGLILDFGTRISNCKQCEVNKSTGSEKAHDCRLNWGGTSKAMESDLAVSLLKNTHSENQHVSTIIGDDDTTTMSKVQKQVPFPVKKQSDINHAKKSLGNDLYHLQKTHKVLQTKVITYLQKCFSYAIKQNENDQEKT